MMAADKIRPAAVKIGIRLEPSQRFGSTTSVTATLKKGTHLSAEGELNLTLRKLQFQQPSPFFCDMKEQKVSLSGRSVHTADIFGFDIPERIANARPISQAG